MADCPHTRRARIECAMREMAFVMSAPSSSSSSSDAASAIVVCTMTMGKWRGKGERVGKGKKEGLSERASEESAGVAGGSSALLRVTEQPRGGNRRGAPRFVMGVGQSVLNPFSFIRHNGGNQEWREFRPWMNKKDHLEKLSPAGWIHFVRFCLMHRPRTQQSRSRGTSDCHFLPGSRKRRRFPAAIEMRDLYASVQKLKLSHGSILSLQYKYGDGE